MDIFILTLEAVLSVIGIGFVGFFIIARRILPGSILQVLTPLVIDIALPCMIFANIITKFDPRNHAGWWTMPLWWILFTAVSFILTMGLSCASKKETRSEFRVSLFYQNAMFIPLALIAGVYGGSSIHLVDLFLFTIFYPSFFFNTYYFFFKKKGEPSDWRINWRMILNPVLLATILAICIRLMDLHIYVPRVLLSVTSSVGGLTIPLIMLIIGGNIFIDLKESGPFRWREIILFCLIKNILYPLFFLGFISITRPPGAVALIFIIESAMPPITASSIVVEREGGDRALANQLLLFSFLFSILTVPVMLTLYGTISGYW